MVCRPPWFSFSRCQGRRGISLVFAMQILSLCKGCATLLNTCDASWSCSLSNSPWAKHRKLTAKHASFLRLRSPFPITVFTATQADDTDHNNLLSKDDASLSNWEILVKG
eukprot:1424405-Amphidinium_carterae.1